MNKDCEIIQDLMPLVIDGVCSDKSREAVEDHVKECPVCAGIYGDLKKDLICGKVPEKKEKKEIDRSLMALLRKKKVQRFLKPFLLGMLIVALAVGGIFGYRYLSEMMVPLDPDQYDILLFRMENGDVAVIADYKELTGSDQQIGVNIEEDIEDPLPEGFDPSDPEQRDLLAGRTVTKEDGVYFLYTMRCKYTAVRPFLGRKGKEPVHKEVSKFIRAKELTDCLGYNICKGNDQVIWSLGDELPAASAEPEEYYRYLKDYRRIYNEIFEYSAEARGYVATVPEAERVDEVMKQHLAYLESKCPELQPWIGEKPEPLDEETVKWAFSFNNWQDWGTVIE